MLSKLAQLSGGYSEWLERANELAKGGAGDEVVNHCLREAYLSKETRGEGFYYYNRNVLMYYDLDRDFHGKMCDFIVAERQYKMLQACRGSFKSSLGSAGYAAYRIGEEYVRTGESKLRILFASEGLALANLNLKKVKQILEWNDTYKRLFGEHKGTRAWTDYGITSRFRKDPRVAEPTVSTIGIDADRVGFHYDVIICDDLEAERHSASRDSIERVWVFYRLLYSLLEPEGEMLIISTRWHYDDIYARILEQNKNEDLGHRFLTLIEPAREGGQSDGEPTLPSRYDDKKLRVLREQQGPYVFACQYLLNPVPDEERTFKESWIKPLERGVMNREGLFIVVSGDFAYTEERMVTLGKVREADYTVILTVAIDEEWNYYIVDWFRSRCSKTEAAAECYRQYFDHGAAVLALQKFDHSHIAETLDQYGFTKGKNIQPDWVSYPARQRKNDRIETALVPLFAAGRCQVPTDMAWLRTELLDFPRSPSKDGLDALCNVVKVSAPGMGEGPKRVVDNPNVIRIEKLKAGTFDPTGRRNDWRNI